MGRFQMKSNAGTQRQPGVQRGATPLRGRRSVRALWRVGRMTFWVGLGWLAVLEAVVFCLLLSGEQLVPSLQFVGAVVGVLAGLTWLRGLRMAIGGVGQAVASSTQDDQLASSTACSFTRINPASGLPMVTSGMDAGGNAYGTNSFDHEGDWNSSHDYGSTDPFPSVNPASGLPMIEHAGIDVAGNPFGVNNDWSSSGFDNSWSSSSHDWGSSSFSSHNMFE